MQAMPTRTLYKLKPLCEKSLRVVSFFKSRFRFLILRQFFFIGTIFIHAIKNIFSFFHKKHITTGRTSLIRRRIPYREIAFRIFRTTEKHTMVFAKALHYGSTAFRTGNTDFLTDRLRIFAFREITARIEFTVTALSNYNISTAKFTFQICLLRFFLFFLHVTGSIKRLCIFTFRIAGTSRKFSESAGFYNHSSAACLYENDTENKGDGGGDCRCRCKG